MKISFFENLNPEHPFYLDHSYFLFLYEMRKNICTFKFLGESMRGEHDGKFALSVGIPRYVLFFFTLEVVEVDDAEFVREGSHVDDAGRGALL